MPRRMVPNVPRMTNFSGTPLGPAQVETQACVVGAGPAGGSLALELASNGVDVVVVEAGGSESSTQTINTIDQDEVEGTGYPIAASRASGIGGSANLWNVSNPSGPALVRLLPLDQLDLEPREWIPNSGWPLSYAELAAYYSRAYQVFGINQQGFSIPSKLQETAETITDNFRVESITLASSTSITVKQRMRLLQASGLKLITGAMVTGIQLEGTTQRVGQIYARTRSGEEITVSAQVFVLAAGGIENARLLLQMAGPDGTGPGNRSGHVGRFFMEHPHRRVALLMTRSDALEGFLQRRGHQPALSREYWFTSEYSAERQHRIASVAFGIDRSAPSDFGGAIWRRRPRDHPGRLGDLWRSALRSARTPQSVSPPPSHKRLAAVIRDPLRSLPLVASKIPARLSAARYRRSASESDHFYSVYMMAEQVPDPSCGIYLSKGVDEWGLPKVGLRIKLDAKTLETIDKGHVLFASDLKERLGAKVVTLIRRRESVNSYDWGYHHMGTTRMHRDPTHGVVDENCRVHELSNLYVAGSSTFPTAGIANPTLTIIALALRLADHLSAKDTN